MRMDAPSRTLSTGGRSTRDDTRAIESCIRNSRWTVVERDRAVGLGGSGSRKRICRHERFDCVRMIRAGGLDRSTFPRELSEPGNDRLSPWPASDRAAGIRDPRFAQNNRPAIPDSARIGDLFL